MADAVHDVFICHASEDKDAVARPLAEALLAAGLTIWFDEYSLSLGDSLRRTIDQGLATSRFGIVILSPAFFTKQWPAYELDGLVQREMGGVKVILPIWHDISREAILGHSPSLADRVAAKSSQPMPEIVRAISRVVYGSTSSIPDNPSAKNADAFEPFQNELREFWSDERPVNVDGVPHWFVRLAGTPYTPERLGTLKQAVELIRAVKVQYRGWDFPHFDRDERLCGHGNSWIASWNQHFGHREYWRLYQSGHFLTTYGVRELTEDGWQKKLEENSTWQRYRDRTEEKVRGFMSFENTIFQFSEAMQLAANLSKAGIYGSQVLVQIELRNAAGLVLSASPFRNFPFYNAASSNSIGRIWTFESDELKASPKDPCVRVMSWFFERFGMLNISESVLATAFDGASQGGL